MDATSARIKLLREMRGYSQKALAEKAGMHEVSLQFYELEMRHPKAEQLERLATALEVDVAFLHPAKIDTPMALYALLFDLIDHYGDVVMEQRGDAVLFGISGNRHERENASLKEAFAAHAKLSPDEFKQWLVSEVRDRVGKASAGWQ